MYEAVLERSVMGMFTCKSVENSFSIKRIASIKLQNKKSKMNCKILKSYNLIIVCAYLHCQLLMVLPTVYGSEEKEFQDNWDEFTSSVGDLYESLMEEYQQLNVEFRKLPNDENGYVQILKFVQSAEEEGIELYPPFNYAVSDIFDYQRPVDERKKLIDDEVGAYLDAYLPNIQIAESAAQMEQWSAVSMKIIIDSMKASLDRVVLRNMSRLLLLEALRAAESGNEEESMRYYGLAQNLPNHFIELEICVDRYGLMVEYCIRNNQLFAVHRLLPAIGNQADIQKWRTLINLNEPTPLHLARRFHGEWHCIMFVFMGEVSFMGVGEILKNQIDMSHGDEALKFLESRAIQTNSYIEWFSEININQLPDFEVAEGLQMPKLQSQMLMENVALLERADPRVVGFFINSIILHYQINAVLDLVEMEKDGIKLDATSVARATNEPMSGQPFIFVEESREIALPDFPDRLSLIEKRDHWFSPMPLPW